MRIFYKEVDNKELFDYLQRLTYENDATLQIIAKLFDMHKFDQNTDFLDSPLWTRYKQDYEEAFAKFNYTKTLFTEYLCERIANEDDFGLTKEEIDIDWTIEDFRSYRVKVTLKNDIDD